MDWQQLLSNLVSKLDYLVSRFDLWSKGFGWVYSMAESEISHLRSLEDDVQKLQRTYCRIQSLLSDAEDRRHIVDESVNGWLLELKAVAFDADDLLDRHRTLRDVAKLARGGDSRKRKRFWFGSGGSHLGLLQYRSIGTEVAKLQDRLKEIADVRKNLQLKPSDGSRRAKSSPDSVPQSAVACFDRSNVVGRAEDCKRIVGALTTECETVPSVIPIYGVAGVGKTALAQLVFDHFSEKDRGGNHPNPKRPSGDDKGKGPSVAVGDDEYVDLKIWVSLPKDCDVITATKEIVDDITKKTCNDRSLNILHHRLKELLDGKKFLLVLDNFWAEDCGFWDTLRAPLRYGAKGSKVLITTRSKVVSSRMTTQSVPPLEGLCESDCWALLRGLAFPHCEETVDPNLEEIGRKIVSRCQGSPLAAKSLGAILYEETDEEVWESIRQEMWALEENNNEILSRLMISYRHLDYPLKQCFAYCSLFPNGYEFDEDEVVQMWIAEGLVQRIGTRKLEAIGGRYFDRLLWGSFFERSHKQKYRMPSLIHDLARLVSKNELLIVEDGVLHDPPGQPRYASLFHPKQCPVTLEKLYAYERLRTLRLYGEPKVGQVPKDLFLKLKWLRLLDLSNSDIEELPDSVGGLLLLRYLGLRGTGIRRLPESVSNLYNLKTLELSECDQLSELPKGTSKLVNLRHLRLHLDWEKDADLNSMPPGIGRLTSLQTLSRFTVTADGDAGVANLMGKKYIRKLALRWTAQPLQISADENRRTNTHEQVADRLRPHTNLQHLWIVNYPGRTFPNWMDDRSFCKLETMRLSGCVECERFPSLGRLPGLKKLHVEKMDRLRNLGNILGFPTLEVLTIRNMLILEKLFEVAAGEIPTLRELNLFSCPRLRELIPLPPTTMLEISECERLNSAS
ncbi:NB-ARC domain [Musa troglodytarum]|uniref:NB-ARC domain n=1 Tax=Musa troglodytarum TaxID=320322 RepID=A0A9E7G9H1_9LILI|nr:NB-ARC domain [Musa troglodytarum]